MSITTKGSILPLVVMSITTKGSILPCKIQAKILPLTCVKLRFTHPTNKILC